MKAKSILLRIEIDGNNVVNFDGDEQKPIYQKMMRENFNYSKLNNNIKLAKKNIYIDPDGKLSHKIKISSNCLRNAIFSATKGNNSAVRQDEGNFLNNIASIEGIVQGYMNAGKKEEIPFKRTSVLCVSSAEQDNSAVSKLEFCSRSGEKKKKDIDDVSDTSIFIKEDIGKVKYFSEGKIDLFELQFVGCDQLKDRMSFNSDMFHKYKEILKTRITSFDSELGYYTKRGELNKIPEYGFILSDEDINFIVKELLKNIYIAEIKRANAFAYVSGLKIKFVYDPLVDRMNNEEGWIDINKETLENLNFEVDREYIEQEFETSVIMKKEFEEVKEKEKQERMAINKAAQEDKRKKREIAKAVKKAMEGESKQEEQKEGEELEQEPA